MASEGRYPSVWHVTSYTQAQLEDASVDGDVAGFMREGEARTLEMVAHMIAGGAELVILQKQDDV
jgi:hypothetical protein